MNISKTVKETAESPAPQGSGTHCGASGHSIAVNAG